MAMISFTYRFTSYTAFLHDLAHFFHTEVKDDVMILPEEIGSGFLKAIHVNDIDTMLYDFTLHKDLILRREKDETEFYTLIFDEWPDSEKISIQIGQEKLDDQNNRKSAIYLTSFLYDIEYTFPEGNNLRGFRICLSRDWMQKYLHLNALEDVLERYISLKTKNIWYKPVDPESRELLQGILDNQDRSLLHYQNKVLRVVEIFFDWLADESQHLSQKTGISRTDIESAQRVEGILTSDEVTIPPTIKELAREVAMSESKLKKVFKTVYGLPVYEYFQRQRMKKARLMLLSGNYSIKDVGYTLGYSNLSNFTLAFKKEFGKLPSNVVKQAK
jgi:AraC-like DNA-binding protein